MSIIYAPLTGDELWAHARVPLNQCKHGYAYHLYPPRNIRLGVFDSALNGFVGLREKGSIRMDVEYHYQTAPPFCTANARLLIERCPLTYIKSGMPSVCDNCGVPCHWVPDEPGAWKGTTHHDAPTDCTEPRRVSHMNKELWDYLWDVHTRHPYEGWYP